MPEKRTDLILYVINNCILATKKSNLYEKSNIVFWRFDFINVF